MNHAVSGHRQLYELNINIVFYLGYNRLTRPTPRGTVIGSKSRTAPSLCLDANTLHLLGTVNRFLFNFKTQMTGKRTQTRQVVTMTHIRLFGLHNIPMFV